MTPETAVALVQRALLLALLLSAPMLLFGLVAGLLISVLQAVTQVQEMTLTFIPKMIAIVAALFIFGQWILVSMLSFTHEIFTLLPQAIR
ncbi:MAG: flagellar biosynthesis protein FliQ [Candidatus Coatesbacteria bacterium]